MSSSMVTIALPGLESTIPASATLLPPFHPTIPASATLLPPFHRTYLRPLGRPVTDPLADRPVDPTVLAQGVISPHLAVGLVTVRLGRQLHLGARALGVDAGAGAGAVRVLVALVLAVKEAVALHGGLQAALPVRGLALEHPAAALA